MQPGVAVTQGRAAMGLPRKEGHPRRPFPLSTPFGGLVVLSRWEGRGAGGFAGCRMPAGAGLPRTSCWAFTDLAQRLHPALSSLLLPAALGSDDRSRAAACRKREGLHNSMAKPPASCSGEPSRPPSRAPSPFCLISAARFSAL